MQVFVILLVLAYVSLDGIPKSFQSPSMHPYTARTNKNSNFINPLNARKSTKLFNMLQRPLAPVVKPTYIWISEGHYNPYDLELWPIVKSKFEMCPVGSFVYGVDAMRYYGSIINLNMTINGVFKIRLACKTLDGVSRESVYSGNGEWGSYGGMSYQKTPARHFRTMHHKTKCMSAVAGIYFNDWTNGEEIKADLPNTDNDHYLTESYTCPVGQAYCGISTVSRTFAQLNRLVAQEGCISVGGVQYLGLACCSIPNPVYSCFPKIEWLTKLSCTGVICKFVIQTGFSYLLSPNEDEQLLVDLQPQLGNTLNETWTIFEQTVLAEIGDKKINDLFITEILDLTDQAEKQSEVNLVNCITAGQQLLLTCGIYQLQTILVQCKTVDKLVASNAVF